MNALSSQSLPLIQPPTTISMPALPLRHLPERVLQFGTGVLLRGLPDYLIAKANRQDIFNGRIVVVKSTDGDDMNAFSRQYNLYSLCIRGVENGQLDEQNVVCSSISRVLSAKDNWDEVLTVATSPDLQIVISNTTEVGIQPVQDDVGQTPPHSFPGKLQAVRQNTALWRHDLSQLPGFCNAVASYLTQLLEQGVPVPVSAQFDHYEPVIK
ncbi:hypothetical protein [Spirosoma aerophilum]